MGELLLRERKLGPRPGLNVIERYTLAVKKDSCIFIGHHP